MIGSRPTSTTLPARPLHRHSLWRAVDLLRMHRSERRARWDADREIARLDGHMPLRLAWRVEELVAPKNRLDLAHELRSLVRDSSPRYLPSASPVNRAAVRAYAAEILAIAGTLSDLERPVAPRGVVLAGQLLTSSAGPLYNRQHVDELPEYLETVAKALERR